ncbi:hypothetical protein [Olsenella uli]
MAADEQTILKVNLLPDNQDASVELASSSPNLDAFVKKIVEHKEEIDVDKITVACDDKKFDADSFKEIVSTSIKGFLDAIVLEQTKFDEVIAGLKEDQAEEDQTEEDQADA